MNFVLNFVFFIIVSKELIDGTWVDFLGCVVYLGFSLYFEFELMFFRL
jgi:hypothetical protein